MAIGVREQTMDILNKLNLHYDSDADSNFSLDEEDVQELKRELGDVQRDAYNLRRNNPLKNITVFALAAISIAAGIYIGKTFLAPSAEDIAAGVAKGFESALETTQKNLKDSQKELHDCQTTTGQLQGCLTKTIESCTRAVKTALNISGVNQTSADTWTKIAFDKLKLGQCSKA